MDTLLERIAWITDAVLQAELTYGNEYDLQAGIHDALERAGAHPRREVVLDTLSRIDIFVPGSPTAGATGVGIEVKIDGTLADVVRQLTRYAEFPEIEALVLVTTRSRHHHVPLRIRNKPVRLITLVGAGL